MDKPLLLTIFGGTGDLTFRKLLPALYSMALDGSLPEHAQILIVGRRAYTDESYRVLSRSWIERFSRLPFTEQNFIKFSARISYYQMDFSRLETFAGLDQYFRSLNIGAHIFYFAVAPRFFSIIAEGLERVSGARQGKIVLEKPFGEDLITARALNRRLEEVFAPNHIYRIDHYLGKEMVRGITAIRFANPVFNYVWDARQIEYIEISALEEVGVETRGGYYDSAGALQDMVQNHLFQILSILAMERPEQFSGAAMHTEQLKVLRALRPPRKETIQDALVLGQYRGYQDEPFVAADSQTETFAALRLFVDNDRWRSMPFYVRTGKKTGMRTTRATIAFRRMSSELPRNLLSIHIQPDEGIHFQFNIKKPGETDEILEARMDICQDGATITQANTPEAYERLLSACMRDDQSWFSQWDQIDAGWSYVEQLRDLWGSEQLRVTQYEANTAGPCRALDFPAQFGHHWHL